MIQKTRAFSVLPGAASQREEKRKRNPRADSRRSKLASSAEDWRPINIALGQKTLIGKPFPPWYSSHTAIRQQKEEK